MKLKKLIAVMLTVTLFVVAFTACTDKEKEMSDDDALGMLSDITDSLIPEDDASLTDEAGQPEESELTMEQEMEVVEIKDPLFKDFLKGWTGTTEVNGEEVYTVKDCLRVNRLWRENPSTDDIPLVNIDDVKYFTNIEVLKLDRNEITDITSVGYLTKLRELKLDQNKITDISALAGCTELTKLDLSGNEGITDISVLKDLKKLEFVDLSGTGVTDTSAVSHVVNVKQD